MQKKDTKKLYNLPSEILFCKKCTISNQRPRISFDENGICSACNFSEYKKKNIDWVAREQELKNLCDRHRKKNGEYDVVVPCSGGKDGSFVAHQLKYKYGMNPLCVTWSPLIPTEIGKKNLRNFINAGFNHIMGTPDPIITRKLTNLSFKYLGDPFQPFIYGQANFPITIAVNFNISLIMYGENGEVEYGGDMVSAYVPTMNIENHKKHYFSNLEPSFWTSHGINEKHLKIFDRPSFDKINQNKTEIHFLGYYKCWDPQENFYYCSENTGFEANPERTEGTYSKYASLDDELDGFHYYLAFIKFGIGRTTSDTAHEIRDGKITRDEGIALVEKYDGEFPSKYYKTFLEYADINDELFNNVIDSWRSDHIWVKENIGSNSKWKLRKPIF